MMMTQLRASLVGRYFGACFGLLLMLGVSAKVINPVWADGEIPDARLMNQRPVELGNYRIYFNAFNSTFIPPEIAQQYDLHRGGRYGIANIAILDASSEGVGKPVTAKVTGHTKNLLSQKNSLKFSEVKEGDAIYYLADFKFSDQELLKFDIVVKPHGSSRSEKLKLEQVFYTD